jgi:trans-2-enoyl-CoA reductase
MDRIYSLMPKVLAFHRHGPPGEVLQMEDISLPPLQPDEVRVEMKWAPINPADLNVLEGTYGHLPPLPAVAGLEGAGVVTETGTRVSRLKPGQYVKPPWGLGTWRETFTAKADDLLVFPPSLAPEQAAVFTVNPPTAWRMLHDFVALKPGDWVIQNAANSAVGCCVIQLARHLGLRTVNLVRRETLFPELKALGADVVLLDKDGAVEAAAEATGASSCRLALNAVGGDSAGRLLKALAPGGTLVTYGAMGKKPVLVGNGQLIFKDVHLHGFWITRWYRSAAPQAVAEMFDVLAGLTVAGNLQTPTEAVYPLAQFGEAVAHARKPERSGKILFRCSS